MKPQTYGFCVLLTILALIVLLARSDAYIAAHQENSRELQALLHETSRDTLKHLQKKTATLIADHSLQQNIRWQLSHSLKKSIDNVISPADIWQIAIFDETCRVYWGSPPSFVKDKCQNVISTNRAFATPTPLTLGFKQKFPDHKHEVFTFVHLQDEWIALYPRLQRLLTTSPAVQIEIKSNTPALNALNFVYKQAFHQHLYVHASLYRKILTYAEISLYVLMAIAICMLFLLSRSHTSLINRDLQNLATWSKHPLSANQPQPKTPDTLISDIFHNINMALQKHLHHLRSTKKQISVKNNLLAETLHENKTLKEQLAHKSSQVSVLEQASKINTHFVQTHINVKEHTQDLRACIFAIYRQKLQPLIALSENWQKKFQSRHVADFLGIYYNPAQEKFLLQLENDLKQLATLAAQTYDALANTLPFTQKLTSDTSDMLEFLQLWERLLVTNNQRRDVSFIHALHKAQELTRSLHTQKIVFRNKITKDFRLHASTEMLVAGFYHLYQALLPKTPANTEIVTAANGSQGGKNVRVTLSPSRQPTSRFSHATHHTHDDVRQFHLNQGKFILQKYGITVFLSWHEHAIVVSTSSVNH